jgi:hypothetical protein
MQELLVKPSLVAQILELLVPETERFRSVDLAYPLLNMLHTLHLVELDELLLEERVQVLSSGR